jgi:uncharacterized protein YqfB (UPF0267 family)
MSSINKKDPLLFTGQLEPNDIKFLFEKSLEKMPLSSENRIQFQRDWEELSQSKEVLRIWNNNDIQGVPEDLYDSLIINTIEKLHHEQEAKDFIKTSKVIGEIVAQKDEFIGDFLLEYRIRHLVYTGVLELKGIPKSMRHYSVKLRE